MPCRALHPATRVRAHVSVTHSTNTPKQPSPYNQPNTDAIPPRTNHKPPAIVACSASRESSSDADIPTRRVLQGCLATESVRSGAIVQREGSRAKILRPVLGPWPEGAHQG